MARHKADPIVAAALVVFVAASLVGLSTNPALATDKHVNYDIPGYSVWWDAFATWLPPGEPGNGDAVTVDDDYTAHIRYGGEECSYLYLGDQYMGAGHLLVDAPAGTWFTVHQREWVGAGGSGTFELRSGWHSCPNIYLGVQGGNGSFSMENGTNLSAGFLYIGGAESTMIQNGGIASCSDALVLGFGPSEGGNYGLYGGLLTTQRLDIGYDGHGTFLQTGGEHDVFGDLNFAVQAGSAGTYHLTGGTLYVYGALTTGAGASTVAIDGGTMTVSGAITVGTLRLGTDSGSEGDYMLGTHGMVVNDLTVGSSGLGFFYQPVGVTTVHTAMHVGREAGGEGTYWLYGTTGILDAPLVYIGERGKGTVNHNAGEAYIMQLTLGREQAGDGTYNLSGTGTLAAQTIVVGEYASGTFHQTGGAVYANVNLFIGNRAGSFGQYLHEAGTCNVTGSVMVGNYAGSNGDYTLSGTGHLVTAYMQVGTMGTATFHQDGGTCEVSNDVWVGNNGGSQGRYAQTAGQNTISGALRLGDQASSQGIYSLDGGSLAAGTELIGAHGVGKFYQTNGENVVTNNVTLGRDAGGYGLYELNGGTFSAHDLFIAAAGNADMVVTNGQAHFHRVRFGDSAGAHGSLTLRGGTVNVEGVISTGQGEGLLVLDGGTIHGATEWSVTDLDVGHAPGVSVSYTFDGLAIGVSGTETIGLEGTATVTQASGSNIIQGGLHIGHANNGLGTIGIGTYNFSGETSSLSAAEVQLGPRGQGTVNQSGGTLTIAGSLVLSHDSVGNGAFHLTGGSLSANDEVVGGDGVGVFTHSAGTNQVATTLIIGHNPTTASTYTLSSEGVLSAHDEHIGETGKAVFRQENGRNTVTADLRIGADTGSDGTYQQIAGFMTASCVYVGFVGKGAYEHSGGQVTVTSGLSVGFVAGATGTYTLSGTARLTAASEAVGDNGGRGTFNHNGGTNTTDALHLGLSWTTANGSYYLRGGDLSAGVENVGYGGTGLMEQTAGTHTVLGNLTVGITSNGIGTVNLKGGILSSASEIVGLQGRGEFNQSAGDNTTASLYLAKDLKTASGTFRLTDGRLFLNGPMYVGCAGTGVVEQSGGGVYSGWSLYAGYQADAKGTYTLSQSALLMAADEFVGYAGQGTVNQTGGANVAASMTLGYAATGTGTYNFGGGTFQANSLVIGKAGAGTYTQTSGSAYGGMITIGDEATATGALSLNGGDLTATDVVNRRTFTQTSGMLIAGSVTNEAGATASISGDAIFLADAVSNLGAFAQAGGVLSPNNNPTVTFDNSGTFTQTGGAFQANLINSGTFNYRGGTFSGNLEHWGSFSMTQSFTAGGGIVNYSYLATAPGCNLTANGSGLDNYGVLSLTPGTSVGGTALTNQPGGLITGAGTVRTTLDNYGTIQTTGSLIVTGAASNYGLITLATAQNLLAQGGLANNGVVELSGGGVTGANFTNQAGGELRGRGNVTARLTNDGGLIHANSTAALVLSNFAGGNLNGGELRIEDDATLNILTPFSSSGTVSLKGLNATLAGGAMTSSGSIHGLGRVSNTVYNSGIIRAEGGQLTFAGSGCTNTAAGRIEVPAGATVLDTQGLAGNAGTISLTGGTFDTDNHAIANAGIITGYGMLRTGGLTIDAGHTLSVGSGNMDVFGPVTNDGTVTTQAGCTTTFYSHANGNGNFPGTGTVVFLDSFSPGHSPGEAEFGGDLVVGGAGSLVMELAGESRGAQYDAIDVAGTLALGGTLDVALYQGFVPRAGDAFDLLNWGSLAGAFDAVDLPVLGGGLSWDASRLYSDGSLTVTPEPATLALLALGGLALLRRRTAPR